MGFQDYKVKGISFMKRQGELFCTIDQCGVKATYPLEKSNYQGKAKYVLMDLDGTTVKSEEFWIWLIEKAVKKIAWQSRIYVCGRGHSLRFRV